MTNHSCLVIFEIRGSYMSRVLPTTEDEANISQATDRRRFIKGAGLALGASALLAP
jgi:hypothetical protein